MNKSVDVKKLRALYPRSEESRAALDYFASRSRNSAETTVDGLRRVLDQKGVIATSKALRDLFADLEAAGCGRLIVGRKGHQTRFAWSSPMASVGKAAAGSDVSVPTLAASDVDHDDDALDDEYANIPMLHHQFNLRPGLEVRLELPKDLTQPEAGRLSDFVKTLPFGF